MAAGDDERWTSEMGYPKHFIEIDGEPLLYRTIRLLAGRTEIVVSGHPDPRYKHHDAALWVPYRNTANLEAEAVMSTRALWPSDDRTILLYGDVWYSEACIEAVLAFEPREWQMFCRFEPSELTGKVWGEPWAWSFWPEHYDEHMAAHHRVIDLVHRDVLWRCDAWEHYRAMCGLPDERMPIEFHGDYGRATVIDDWTEDFDFPHDLTNYLDRRAA
jgi:hypothetical protein